MKAVEVWPDDPVEDQRRFTSSLALVNFARTCPELHPNHRTRLVDEAIWFWTERGSKSRKYLLRFRSPAAWERQQTMSSLTLAAKGGALQHEHVHEKALARVKLLDPASDPGKVLASMRACVITQAEHQLLAARPDGVTGWARYLDVGIRPVDMNTGEPMDLEAAVAADVVIWG